MRALRAREGALAEDAKAAAATIRAKDKQLDLAAVRVDEARLIAMENKARQGLAKPEIPEVSGEQGAAHLSCVCCLHGLQLALNAQRREASLLLSPCKERAADRRPASPT